MDKLLKVSQQTLWQVVGKAVSSLSTIVVLAILSHRYSQSDIGIYTLALTFLAFFYLASDLGLNAYILQDLHRAGKLADKLYSFRVFWSFLLVLFANLLAMVLPFSNPAFRMAVLFGSISIFGNAIFNSTNLIFQNKLQYKYSILASSLGSLVMVPLVYYFAKEDFPISNALAATALSWIVIALVALFFVGKYHKFSVSFWDFKFIRKTLVEAWPLSATLLLNVVYFRVDSFILSSTRSFSEVGIYNFAFQFFQTALVLPTFIMNVFYPLMLKGLREDVKKFFKQIRIAGLGLLGVSLLGVVLTYLTSPLLIEVVGGGKFKESLTPLLILSYSFPAFFLSSLCMWILVSYKKYKTLVLVYGLGLVVNVVLNLIFIPHYSFVAASWITGLSEYLILGLQFVILFKVIRDR